MRGGNPVDRIVVGILSGLEPRGEWVRYSIMEPGKQYPVKVDTKKPEIISACNGLMGQMVSAQVHEEDSGNANPHRPGTEYRNRYLNVIAPAQPGAMSTPPQQPQQQAYPQQYPQQAGSPPATAAPQQAAASWNEVTPSVKELHILREHAMDQVVKLVNGGHVEFDPVQLVEAAEVFVAYYQHGPARFGVDPNTGRAPEQPAQPAQPANNEQQSFDGYGQQQPYVPAGAAAGAYPDDDIPF